MAMRILASRLIQQGANGQLPLRMCCASSSSSSSSSTPSKTSSSTPDAPKKRYTSKESLRSYLATFLGGNLEPANPDDPPIRAEDVRLPHATDFATGEEKLFLLAYENGIMDPYCNMPVERNGRGTKDNPVLVGSFVDERIVGCVCEESANSVRYFTLCKGEPKRCSCGHWMELVDAPRFWQKIPKDDLLDIPFFYELEQEGKLDKLLKEGKSLDDPAIIDDHHHGHGHGHEQKAH